MHTKIKYVGRRGTFKNDKHGGHFKITGQSDLIFGKTVLEAWEHTCVKFETSIMISVLRIAVHTQ